jgi:hypothetical protein
MFILLDVVDEGYPPVDLDHQDLSVGFLGTRSDGTCVSCPMEGVTFRYLGLYYTRFYYKVFMFDLVYVC